MKIEAHERRERLPIGEAIRGAVHAVQFYETDDYLLQTLADYVAGALAAGDAAIVVATETHRSALDERSPSAGSISLSMSGQVPIFLSTPRSARQVRVPGELLLDGRPRCGARRGHQLAPRPEELVAITSVRDGGRGGTRTLTLFRA
jgi:hypothetical protein